MTKKLKVVISASVIAAIVCCAIAVFCYLFAKPISSKLTIAVNEMSLAVDEKKKLEFECSDCDAEITIEVYDETVIELDGEYVVGRKVGSTSLRITAMNNDERAIATMTIYVTENPTGLITDLPSEITLYLLDKETATANEEGFYNEISFVSYKEYEVSADNNGVKLTNGKIVAQKEGQTTLTFKAKNFDQSQIVTINVLKFLPEVEGLPDEIDLNLNESTTFVYEIKPAYYYGEAVVTFVVDNKLELEGNTIIAKEAGVAFVVVNLNDVFVKTIKVNVKSDKTFIITSLSGGYIENDKIYATEDMVMFKIVADDGVSLESEVSSTSGKVSREMDFIILEEFESCLLTIYFVDLGESVNIEVIKT